MKLPTVIPWRPGQPQSAPVENEATAASATPTAKAVPPAAPAALAVDTAPIDDLLRETPDPAHRPASRGSEPALAKAPSSADAKAQMAEPSTVRTPIQLSAPPPALAGPAVTKSEATPRAREAGDAHPRPEGVGDGSTASLQRPVQPGNLPPSSTSGKVPPGEIQPTAPVPTVSASAAADTDQPLPATAATLSGRLHQLRSRMPSRAAAGSTMSRARDQVSQRLRDTLKSHRSAQPDTDQAAARTLATEPNGEARASARTVPRLSWPSPARWRLPSLPPAVWSAIRVVKRVLWRPRVGRMRLGWLTWASALLAAAMVHIAATFSVPQIANGESALARRFFPLALLGATSAFSTVKRQLPVNTMVVLPPAQAGKELLPFLAPDMRYAVCRFDISAGPLQVSAMLPERGWSLAIHTANGDNPYIVPAPNNRPLDVSFLLVPTTDRLFNLTPGQRRLNTDATQVATSHREGLIVIRAPVAGVAFDGAALATLQKATCTPAER